MCNTLYQKQQHFNKESYILFKAFSNMEINLEKIKQKKSIKELLEFSIII